MYETFEEGLPGRPGKILYGNNTGHRPRVKGALSRSIRRLACTTCVCMCGAMACYWAWKLKVHHHEVGTCWPVRIGVGAATLTRKTPMKFKF